MSKLLYFERLLSSDGCLANSLFLPCDWKRCLSDKFCKVFTSVAHSLPYSCTSCWSSNQGQLCPPSHQCGAGRSSTVWSLTATVTALDDRVLKLMSCCSKNKFSLCPISLQCCFRILLLWSLEVFFWFPAQICSLPGCSSLFFCQHCSLCIEVLVPAFGIYPTDVFLETKLTSQFLSLQA